MVLAANGAGGGGDFTIWILLALLFGAMYFFMIRPQQRRRREVEAMQSRMGPGDEVVTVGGLYGTIQTVDDETVQLEVAPGVVARYARAAISRVVTSAGASGPDTATEDGTDTETTANRIINPD